VEPVLAVGPPPPWKNWVLCCDRSGGGPPDTPALDLRAAMRASPLALNSATAAELYGERAEGLSCQLDRTRKRGGSG
jgi:hypothetical protein